jgi:lambda repressor-like predicted transcriptional regulator
VAIAAKLLLAGWCLRHLHRRGDLSARGLQAILAAWVAAVAVLFALLVWLVPEGFVPRYGLAFAAVLTIPLARLALAPLALASNRHR